MVSTHCSIQIPGPTSFSNKMTLASFEHLWPKGEGSPPSMAVQAHLRFLCWHHLPLLVSPASCLPWMFHGYIPACLVQASSGWNTRLFPRGIVHPSKMRRNSTSPVEKSLVNMSLPSLWPVSTVDTPVCLQHCVLG